MMLNSWDWNWKYTAGILCLVGLTKEFQPSEPFMVDYAVEFRNFTASQMVHEILPFTTYGYFASLLVLLFITDFLRYKPIIILGAVASLVTWSLTIWWYDTLWRARIRHIIESISLSAELAYVTYMYANVDRSFYRKVTSYAHSALHTGRFLGGMTGQLILSGKLLDLEDMNFLSLGGVGVSLLLSLFLPTVKRSIYFDTQRFSVISTFSGSVNRPSKSSISNSSVCNTIQRAASSTRKMAVSIPKPKETGIQKKIVRASRALWRDFNIAYRNRHVLKWSLWWSIAQAIYLQVGLYAEPLWSEIEEETHESIYNGIIDASHAFLSAALGIFIVFIRFPMEKWGEIYLAGISLIQGAVLFWMSQTHHLYVAYGCYIVFQTLFQVVIIIATAEVAEGVKEDSEAFIFGLNTLLALIIQAVLTYAVADEKGLFDLEIRDEFVVYSVYLGLLGLIFIVIGIQGRSGHWDVHKGHSNHGETFKKCRDHENETNHHNNINGHVIPHFHNHSHHHDHDEEQVQVTAKDADRIVSKF